MDFFGVRSLPFLSRRNYLVEIRHIIPWSLLAGLVEGDFASIVVSKSFGGSPLLISIAVATPVAALTFSIFWGMLCIGRPKIKLLTICCAGTALLSAGVAPIPATDLGTIWFIVQVAAAQVFLSGVVTIRSALWKSNYPHSDRGRITARLQGVRQVTGVAASMGAAALCDVNPFAFRYIYPAAAVCGVVGIIMLTRMQVRGERRELRGPAHGDREIDDRRPRIEPFTVTTLLSPRRVFGQMVEVLRKDVWFAEYCLAQFFQGFSNLMVRSVAALLITRELLLPDKHDFFVSTILIVALPKLLLLLSLGKWGRLFDRVGVLRFRVLNVSIWALGIICGLIATLIIVYLMPDDPSYLSLAVLFFALRGIFSGVGLGGGALAWHLGHLQFAKREEAEIYMGIHVSLTGFRGAIAPLVGIGLWSLIGWQVWLIAAVLSCISIAMYASMARRERKGKGPKRSRQ